MVATRKDKKKVYLQKLAELVEEYPRVMIAQADNVTSQQFHNIRHSLRGKAVILMGKNTLMKRGLRDLIETNPKLERLSNLIKLNVGLIFTHGDLNEIREAIDATKVAAPARVGAVAPCDVSIPAGPTGLEPTKTSFFQALNIATKISKNQVDILTQTQVITAGNKVGNSEATLLQMLNIKPFSYGLEIAAIYDDGTVYTPEVLDLTDDDMAKKFSVGIANLAALSLGIGFPTAASLPHVLINGFKNLLAVSVASDYTIEQAKEIKYAIEHPDEFAGAAAAAPSNDNATSDNKQEAQQEEDEESDEEMGFGLFGDD